MHMFTFLLALSNFCAPVLDLNAQLKPMQYTTAFTESFQKLRDDILERHYKSAAALIEGKWLCRWAYANSLPK